MSDNWDDGDSAPVTSFSNRSFNRGEPAPTSNNGLLGMGRGQKFATATSNGFGSSESFGGRPADSGFRNERAIMGNGGGFGSCSNGDSFKQKDGGFGSQNGFEETSTFGFGSDRNADGGFRSRGGGFGSKGDRGSSRGGDGKCFVCGEEGHMSRDCPSKSSSGRGGRGGGGGSRACHKCNEEGHMARDCPKSSAGGSRGCFNCGEDGHMSRDCPNPRSSSGARGGRSSGESRGGFSRGFGDRNGSDEPRGGGFERRNGFGGAEENGFGNTERSGFGGMRSGFGGGGGGGFEEKSEGFGNGRSFGSDRKDDRKGCYKCGEDGHMSRDCPKGGSGGGGGGKGCFKCGEEGHMSRDCPNSAGTDGDKKPRSTYVPPPEPEDEEHIFTTLMKGINFDKYDQIKVECTGVNALRESNTIKSFETSDLDDIFKENIRKSKYDKPTPIQKWAIPAIMSGRDIMACAQTGSGKTAAFLLPVLTLMRRQGVEGSLFSEYQTPQAIVVGPTRELVVQIHLEARKFSHNTMVRSVVTYGGTSKNSQRDQLRKGAHIVVGTPGRLLDFIKEGVINLSKVRFLILDEADRMLDLGFMPTIQELINNPQIPPKTERQTLMFSATFPDDIQRLAREIMREDYLFLTVGRVGGANADIEQIVLQVDQYGKRDQLISILNETGCKRVLIFVEQKRQADFLASFLSQTEFPTTSIHGDREQREREEALLDFKKGVARILVATSVAARGLDIPGVDHVINYDMPDSIEDYVHRIGRTARCGNTGKATSFFDASKDHLLARPLVTVLTDAQQMIPDWLESMAESNIGSGGFTGTGGQFGSRDTRNRRGNYGGGRGGGRSNDFDDNVQPTSFSSAPTAGFGSSAASAAVVSTGDDDMWD